MTSDTVAAIAAYLGSPRSRTLRELDFSHFTDSLIEEGVLQHLVDVVEARNFSLGLLRIPLEYDYDIKDPKNKPQITPGVTAQVERLSACMARNKAAFHDPRVQKAAVRYLSAARILLHAKAAPSPQQSVPTGDITAPFRLLDLPAEIISQIILETSGDVGALSRRQWDRLQREVEGKVGLREMVRAGKRAGEKFRDEWARWAGVDRWED